MSTFTSMSIGKEIERERKAQRYSQRQLAKEVGCKQQEISTYENGTVTPSTERLEKIAKVLGKEWKLK